MQIITRPFFFWRWPVAFIFPASDVFLGFRAKWHIWCGWSLANSVEYGPLSCGLSWGTSFVSPTGTFLLAWHWTRVLRTVKSVPRGCLGFLLWPQLLVLLGKLSCLKTFQQKASFGYMSDSKKFIWIQLRRWKITDILSEQICPGFPCTRPSQVAQTVKNLPVFQKTSVRSLGQEDRLEKGTATHSNIPSPGTEEPGRLKSLGSQRVRHD